MLLVTFHGGSHGINNIVAYGADGTVLTSAALSVPDTVVLLELRGMVLANGHLYVANGAESTSTVLCFDVPSSGSSFTYASTVIGATLKNGQFETSIAHPFGITLNGTGTCYVSNQDTNVVAKVDLTSNNQSGNLGKGCQSAYLNRLYPKGTFLDGTYAASQVGHLHDVNVEATPVSAKRGGLGVTPHKGKVQNSVRDVTIANGILFVCNEPDSVVNMYSLADGKFLGSSKKKLAGKPTHLAIFNAGLYVSAGKWLYWGALPTGVAGASLDLQKIALTPPQGNKIGGISFDNGSAAPTVYIPFQAGTGGTGGGSIYAYTVTLSSNSSLPVLSDAKVFVGSDALTDTPEFVLQFP
jgi:hypothetical protein